MKNHILLREIRSYRFMSNAALLFLTILELLYSIIEDRYQSISLIIGVLYVFQSLYFIIKSAHSVKAKRRYIASLDDKFGLIKLSTMNEILAIELLVTLAFVGMLLVSVLSMLLLLDSILSI